MTRIGIVFFVITFSSLARSYGQEPDSLKALAWQKKNHQIEVSRSRLMELTINGTDD